MKAEKQLKKTEFFLKAVSNFNSTWSVGVHLSGGLTMNLSFSSESCLFRVLDGSVMHSFHHSLKKILLKITTAQT